MTFGLHVHQWRRSSHNSETLWMYHSILAALRQRPQGCKGSSHQQHQRQMLMDAARNKKCYWWAMKILEAIETYNRGVGSAGSGTLIGEHTSLQWTFYHGTQPECFETGAEDDVRPSWCTISDGCRKHNLITFFSSCFNLFSFVSKQIETSWSKLKQIETRLEGCDQLVLPASKYNVN